MGILRAIAGGERDAQKLAKLRDRRCSKTEQQIAEQLSGHWREDHLFSLQQALKMYDAVQERIAAYEQEIVRQLGEMERDEQRDQTAPPLPNTNKARMIKQRGQEAKRQALYRMSGVDITQIDAIGVETVEVVLSEYGCDLSCCTACPQERRQAHQEEKAEQRQYACRRGLTYGGALSAPQPERPGRILSQAGATHRRRRCRVCYGEEVGHSDLPASAMGPALCGPRCSSLRKSLSAATHHKLDG